MSKNNQIEYIVGSKKIIKKTLEPFSDKICNFLNKFSKKLNSHPKSREFSDIRALAFWCRKKNIIRLKNSYKFDQLRLGLGLIFHITPSNIPTNFAYSLLFGLLTGNSNIVKLPSQKFPQVEIICQILKKLTQNKENFKNMITIVRYKNHDFFTAKFSSICNARLIWGGDNSIKNIKQHSVDQKCLDLTFADRYSFCLISTSEILKLNTTNLQRLVEKFYNDTYLVDQNACSSPHLIIWYGEKYHLAKTRFWKHLNKLVSKKYNLTDFASMDKYTKFIDDILNLNNIKKSEKFDNFIYTIDLKNLDKNTHKLRGKWGFFYEYNTMNINKIIKSIVNNKYQTLTYFGINKKTLFKFILKNKLQGIDRVVPIGQALDISLFWDGYDIIRMLTRVTDIK